MGEDMLPEAFLERMQQMLGGEYGAFLETFSQERFHALRLNPLKLRLDGQSAAQVLGAAKGVLEGAEERGSVKLGKRCWTKVPWAEDGYYYSAEEFPGKHPYHEAGLYYIQEPSAMAPVELLDVRPGCRALDLCAAPGGKSTQIAAKMKGDGVLVCNEIHPARAKILSENIERMGVCNACVTNETPERLAELFTEYFDRILVDAPCSGEGMFRKNDTACEEWSPENVALCAERQDGILDCAARMLRPGGRLVYSTCTFAPKENEGSITRFLQRHTDFEIVPVLPMEKEKLGLAGCDGVPEYLEEPVPGLEGTLRLWPHRIKGEGHYAAVLEKTGGPPSKYASSGSWPEACGSMQGQSAGGGSQGSRSADCGNLESRSMDCGNSGIQPEPYRSSGTGGKPWEIERKELADFVDFCCESFGIWDTETKIAEDRMKVSGRPLLKGGLRQAKINAALRELGELTGMCGELRMLRFGDNLYLAPAGMPALSGLKVLRPGLHLGELKKNRFEPSHALALAVRPQRAAHTWNLKAGERTVLSYLNGETFPAEGEKGWYLICVDGFGIGWGKLAGGIMKNHYPKGLRRSLDRGVCAAQAGEPDIS